MRPGKLVVAWVEAFNRGDRMSWRLPMANVPRGKLPGRRSPKSWLGGPGFRRAPSGPPMLGRKQVADPGHLGD